MKNSAKFIYIQIDPELKKEFCRKLIDDEKTITSKLVEFITDYTNNKKTEVTK